MLLHVAIKNFTIVESLELDFSPGFTVFTGETGAGKSIVVDAVSLALGARADQSVIRHQAKQCDISLSFDVEQIAAAKAWLNAQQLTSDNDCIIRRTIQRDGKSRSTINGHPCPLQLVREFSELVLQIHGQHQHQALLKRDYQQVLFDHYAGHDALLNNISECYEQWHNNEKEIATLTQQAEHRDYELDLMRYQYEELLALKLQDQEWQALNRQHDRLQNAKLLIANLNQALQFMTESEPVSATTLLQQAMDRINDIKMDDPNLNDIKELLNTAMVYLSEASLGINHYRRDLDLSDHNLEAIEERLGVIFALARKHHVTPDELKSVQQSLQHRIESLERLDEQLESLRTNQTILLERFQKIAEPLSLSRQKIATTLQHIMNQYMQSLGMTGGQFRVVLEPINEIISRYGNEKIIFHVSTNIGSDFLPLAKIVSGGELSRIGLALQVITAQKNQTPTLIFDEVDTGIGGKTADVVGRLLRDLGDKTQVICITHLPQVAGKGHQHYHVQKTVSDNQVATHIDLLSTEARVNELARMLSGAKITPQTLSHAETLIE